MENGLYFPTSFESWQNGTADDDLITEDLLVSQPVETAPPEKVVRSHRKKKKKPEAKKYETFHDKYTLSTEVLGRGANSLVTLAVENSSSREVAVKTIEKYEGYDRCRVLREIDLLHYLNDCPNILHLYDSYEEDERFYLIFERMEGGSLLSHIERKGFFTEREASLVLRDISTALKYLHNKGISHRDLKPDNILCIKKDKIVPAVICDFNLSSGIAVIADSVTTPELYTPVGSAEYMAPEVVDAFVSDACYDKKCDVWSLGVILYIMLSGRAPFQGNCGEGCDWERGGSCRKCKSLLWHSILDADYSFPEAEWSGISVEAKDLISHLLVKEASKRYSLDSVLEHPWMIVASNNELSTPTVLSNTGYSKRLSCVTSEAMAYRRIISERQSSLEKEKHQFLSRWSTPPKFGLSPPGNSRLAKRRSLKNKLKLPIDDSFSKTPTASPDVETLLEKVLQIDSDENNVNIGVADYHDKLKRLSEKESAATRLWPGTKITMSKYL